MKPKNEVICDDNFFPLWDQSKDSEQNGQRATMSDKRQGISNRTISVKELLYAMFTTINSVPRKRFIANRLKQMLFGFYTNTTYEYSISQILASEWRTNWADLILAFLTYTYHVQCSNSSKIYRRHIDSADVWSVSIFQMVSAVFGLPL